MVGALEDTTTLTNQLKEVRAANTKCQEEIKQLQLTLQSQQVRAQEWKQKFDELKLVSSLDVVTIRKLQHEVELYTIAEVQGKEVQAKLQTELDKYVDMVTQLEERHSTVATDLTTAHHRISELEQMQSQAEEFIHMQHRAQELEAQVTQLEVKLQQERANRISAGHMDGHSAAIAENVAGLELQLTQKTDRIEQLETQLRTLALKNAELTEQLEGPEPEDDEETDDAEEKHMDTHQLSDAVIQVEVPDVVISDAVAS